MFSVFVNNNLDSSNLFEKKHFCFRLAVNAKALSVFPSFIILLPRVWAVVECWNLTGFRSPCIIHLSTVFRIVFVLPFSPLSQLSMTLGSQLRTETIQFSVGRQDMKCVKCVNSLHAWPINQCYQVLSCSYISCSLFTYFFFVLCRTFSNCRTL